MIEMRFLGDALVRILGRQADLEVVGRSGAREVPFEEIISSGCNVLLVDRVDCNWLATCRASAQRVERLIKVVAIGMDSDQELFLEAVRSGVHGYLLKDSSVSDVVASVRAADCGSATCPREMCTVLFNAVAEIDQRRPRTGPRLTVRQQALMKLVAKGLTNKQIAEELHLSQFTVKNHISRILKHLDVPNRSAAVELVQPSRDAQVSSFRSQPLQAAVIGMNVSVHALEQIDQVSLEDRKENRS